MRPAVRPVNNLCVPPLPGGTFVSRAFFPAAPVYTEVYVMKKFVCVLLAGVWAGPAFAVQPTTQVKVVRPTTQVTVSRPTTQTAVYRPTTSAAVNRPVTTTSVTRPTTQVQVVRPTTEVGVFRPVTAGNAVTVPAAAGAVSNKSVPASSAATPSSSAKTSMSGYKPPVAKDFKAPSSASAGAAGSALSLGNQVNEGEKDAAAAAQQKPAAQTPSNLSAQQVMANSKAISGDALQKVQNQIEERQSSQQKK